MPRARRFIFAKLQVSASAPDNRCGSQLRQDAIPSCCRAIPVDAVQVHARVLYAAFVVLSVRGFQFACQHGSCFDMGGEVPRHRQQGYLSPGTVTSLRGWCCPGQCDASGLGYS